MSQTSTYLGAILGAGEQDMAPFESVMGQVMPVTTGDAKPGRSRPILPPTDSDASEMSEQDPSVH